MIQWWPCALVIYFCLVLSAGCNSHSLVNVYFNHKDYRHRLPHTVWRLNNFANIRPISICFTAVDGPRNTVAMHTNDVIPLYFENVAIKKIVYTVLFNVIFL